MINCDKCKREIKSEEGRNILQSTCGNEEDFDNSNQIFGEEVILCSECEDLFDAWLANG